MSYGVSAALQAAVFQRLQGDAQVAALSDGAVFDAAPPGPVPPLYVTLGPETVRDRSDGSGGGALHLITISVVTGAAGFAAAKTLAAAVGDALGGADLALTRGRLVALRFDRARAFREGDARRIDLVFGARVDDD